MCRYASICWRNAYSKYLLKYGTYPNATAPRQAELVLQGFADGAMLDHARSVFAKNLPHRQGGELVNLCPHLCNQAVTQCEEYTKRARADEKRAQVSQQRKTCAVDSRVFIPRDVRKYVAQRDKYTCVFCRRHIHTLKSLNIKSHIDHIIPLSRGGHPTDPENLCFACAPCNQAKFGQVWEFGCRENFYK